MNEYKYLLGSKMLKLENNRDEDWVIFFPENTKAAREKGGHSIAFFKTILKHFINGKKIAANPYNALYLYQLSNGFILDESYPFKDFNILEHQAVWINWITAYMCAAEVEAEAIKATVLPKEFYHILYQYYMIKENTHWISDEAKAKVQKIHDLEMPSSYFEELRALINSL